MDMASLFPHEANAGSGGGGGNEGTPHVAFKCGRMDYDAGSGLVTPDERRGMLQIVTGADLLTHLQWRTRPGGSVDANHDLIIFPGLAEMKPVASAPSGSRVYVLKWIDANTRMFFWMQDGDATQDTPNISRLNSILQNGPHQENDSMLVDSPPVAVDRSAPAQPSTPATTDNAAVPAATTGAAGGARNGLTLDALSRMLDAMPNVNAGGVPVPQPVVATVGDLLRTPQLAELISSNDLDLSAVYETIPEVERNPESVKQLLRCEAVQSQALSLTRALMEAPPSDVLPSIGLPLPDTPGSMGMKALIEAIKKAANQKP